MLARLLALTWGTVALAAPSAVPSPTSVSFGTVRLNSSPPFRPVELRNGGDQPLTITAASVSAPFYVATAPSLPITVQPSDKVTFQIGVSPSTLGSLSGTLSITSNAPQSPTQVPLSATSGAPQLSLTPSSLAFADVTVGGSGASRQVSLRNAGTFALSLTSAQVSAPFSVSGLGALSLAPGQTRTFTVSYAPTAAGAHADSVVLQSDDPASPHLLAVSGTAVAPKLSLSPTSLAFGDVPVGSSASASVVLTNTGTGTLVLQAPTVTGPLAVQVPAGTQVLQGASLTVQVTARPTVPGTFSGEVAFASNDVASPARLFASGTAKAASLSVTPSALALGTVALGATQSGSLVLSNAGDVPLTVTALNLVGTHAQDFELVGAPSLPAVVAAQGTLSLSVRFSPQAPQNRSASLSIESNRHPAGPVTVALSGVGEGPKLEVSPVSLSFGTVYLGQSASRSVSVSNGGNKDLTVSSLTFTGANAQEFAAGATLPLVLAPGQSQSLTVSLSPASVGAKAGALVLSSNDARAPSTEVALDGTAQSALLELAPHTLAFVDVEAQDSMTLPFTLKNVGSASATVSSGALGGLDAARFQVTGLTYPVTLAPGSTVTGKVTFTPNAVGRFRATLSLATTSGALQLGLTGNGITGAMALSADRLDFGGRLIGQPPSVRTVELLNHTQATLTISSAALAGDGARAYSFSPSAFPLLVPAQGRQAFAVSFAPTEVQEARARLSLQTSKGPAQVELSGVGLSSAALSASVASLDFGLSKAGLSDTLSVLVTNGSGRAMMLREADLTGPGAPHFKAPFPEQNLGPGQSLMVSVTYAPRAAGESNAELVFSAVDPAVPAVVVALRGTAVSQLVEATPAVLDFGSVELGQRVTQHLSLKTKGSRPLQVRLAIKDPMFELQTVAPVLLPGEGATVGVIFTPREPARSVVTTLSVRVEGRDEVELMVPLSGNVVRPPSRQGCAAVSEALPGRAWPWVLLVLVWLGLSRATRTPRSRTDENVAPIPKRRRAPTVRFRGRAGC